MAPLQGSGVMLVEHDSHLRGSMPKQLTDAERKAKNRHEAEELQMNTYKFQESSEHGMFEREDKLNEALQRYVTDVLKPRHVLEEEYIQTLERTELRKQLQSVPLTDTDEERAAWLRGRKGMVSEISRALEEQRTKATSGPDGPANIRLERTMELVDKVNRRRQRVGLDPVPGVRVMKQNLDEIVGSSKEELAAYNLGGGRALYNRAIREEKRRLRRAGNVSGGQVTLRGKNNDFRNYDLDSSDDEDGRKKSKKQQNAKVGFDVNASSPPRIDDGRRFACSSDFQYTTIMSDSVEGDAHRRNIETLQVVSDLSGIPVHVLRSKQAEGTGGKAQDSSGAFQRELKRQYHIDGDSKYSLEQQTRARKMYLTVAPGGNSVLDKYERKKHRARVRLMREFVRAEKAKAKHKRKLLKKRQKEDERAGNKNRSKKQRRGGPSSRVHAEHDDGDNGQTETPDAPSFKGKTANEENKKSNVDGGEETEQKKRKKKRKKKQKEENENGGNDATALSPVANTEPPTTPITPLPPGIMLAKRPTNVRRSRKKNNSRGSRKGDDDGEGVPTCCDVRRAQSDPVLGFGPGQNGAGSRNIATQQPDATPSAVRLDHQGSLATSVHADGTGSHSDAGSKIDLQLSMHSNGSGNSERDPNRIDLDVGIDSASFYSHDGMDQSQMDAVFDVAEREDTLARKGCEYDARGGAEMDVAEIDGMAPDSAKPKTVAELGAGVKQGTEEREEPTEQYREAFTDGSLGVNDDTVFEATKREFLSAIPPQNCCLCCTPTISLGEDPMKAMMQKDVGTVDDADDSDGNPNGRGAAGTDDKASGRTLLALAAATAGTFQRGALTAMRALRAVDPVQTYEDALLRIEKTREQAGSAGRMLVAMYRDDIDPEEMQQSLIDAGADGDVTTVKVMLIARRRLKIQPDGTNNMDETGLYMTCARAFALERDMTDDVVAWRALAQYRTLKGMGIGKFNSCIACFLALECSLDHRPDVADNPGWGLIHLAARDGLANRVRWLVKRGANKDLVTMAEGYSALTVACRNKHFNVIIALVEAKVNLLSRDDDGWTALHHSARVGSYESVRLLLLAGASKHATNEDHETPMDVARRFGRNKCWKAIVQYSERKDKVQGVLQTLEEHQMEEARRLADEMAEQDGGFFASATNAANAVAGQVMGALSGAIGGLFRRGGDGGRG